MTDIAITDADREAALAIMRAYVDDGSAKAAQIAARHRIAAVEADRRGRTFSPTELDHARAAGERIGLEKAAKVADRRAEQRFAEYGVREPDTNATYYEGRRAEAYEELDEEDEAIASEIRAMIEGEG